MKLNFHNWSLFKKEFPNITFTKEILKESLLNQFKKENIQKVDILFVKNSEIRKLNREFRKKDTATDVLTFEIDKEPLIGEIYISVEYISKEYSFDEVLRSIVHGILHLLGYDHKGHFTDNKFQNEKMFVKQENILQNISYEINNRVRKSRRKIS